MDILIFSDSKIIDKCFAGIKRSKDFTLNYHKTTELKKILKKTEKGAFIYIDISKFDAQERGKTLKYLSKLEGYGYGIIDPKGVINDIVLLLLEGATDYIGKELFKNGVTSNRIKKISAFKGLDADMKPEIAEKKPSKTSWAKNYILSGNDWGEVKTGKEYTFALMLFDLDNQKELRHSISAQQSKEATESLKKYIEEKVAPFNGHVWMWKDFGGLILFPFNGKRCDAILTCCKLALSKKHLSFEGLSLHKTFSYRIALHIGNTVYRRKGDTGTIVSDSINSIFHLGQKFTEEGNFCISEEALEYAPEGLKKGFLPAGTFEGRNIFKMRMPVQ